MAYEESLKIAIIAALSGGLAIFIFERLSSLMRRILERKIRHYNSIVFYEGQLNNNLSRLYDILFTIPNITKHLKDGNITWNNLRIIEFDGSLLKNIYSEKLRNTLGSYEVDQYKLNDDLESLMNGYQEIKQALIQKNIKHEEYSVNCESFIKNLDLIYKFTEMTIQTLLDALTDVRLRIKTDNPRTSIFIKKIIMNGLKEYTKEEFKMERKKLDREIDEASTTRKKEIDKILK
ncbi:MAG: hypothetical protein M1355_01355 [Patescibacteria group bacterium]|nr:hypothetical protein [Patescibacteria group bacterium]